jgi:hypothetical protein
MHGIVALLVDPLLIDGQHPAGAGVYTEPAAFAGFLVNDDFRHEKPPSKLFGLWFSNYYKLFIGLRQGNMLAIGSAKAPFQALFVILPRKFVWFTARASL